jgi:hypothetical protein
MSGTVPGNVYVIDGRLALLVSLQMTPGGNGHGDMLQIGTFANASTTWTKDVTGAALEECKTCTAVYVDGVATIVRNQPATPLNDSFWSAIAAVGDVCSTTRPTLIKYLQKGLTPRQIRGWAELLFETLDDHDEKLGFTDLSTCSYPVGTLQLIMWWIRRTAMSRFRDTVPMGGGTLPADSPLAVQTRTDAASYRSSYRPGAGWETRRHPLVMAARMHHMTAASVPTGVADPNTTVFETQYWDKRHPAAQSKFEALLINESRAFGDRALSSACLAFISPENVDPWQVQHGYHRMLNPDLWKTGTALTAPNGPWVLLLNGEKAGPLIARNHVATVWPKVLEQMCPELKRAVMIKLADTKAQENAWINTARAALVNVMRERGEYAELFRNPDSSENSFYPAMLRSHIARNLAPK